MTARGGAEIAVTRIISGIPDFVAKLLNLVKRHGIDVDGYFLDHVCYRVSTEEEYQSCVRGLEAAGELLIESEIGGRLISTFKLAEPVLCQDSSNGRVRAVDVIELPSPKPGSFYPSGLEHAEFVVDSTLEEFEQKYPLVAFDRKGFKKALNRDLRLDLGEGLSCKFHEQSLEEVIKIEKRQLRGSNH